MGQGSIPDRATPGHLRREVGAAIRRARKRLGLNQEEFGRRLGEVLGRPVSQSQISGWERGGREPHGSVLLAVATVLGVTLDEWVLNEPGKDEPFPSRPIEQVGSAEGAGDRLDGAAGPEGISARLLQFQERIDGWVEMENALRHRITLLEARLKQFEASAIRLNLFEYRLDQLEARSQYVYDEIKAAGAALARVFNLLEQAGLQRDEGEARGGLPQKEAGDS